MEQAFVSHLQWRNTTWKPLQKCEPARDRVYTTRTGVRCSSDYHHTIARRPLLRTVALAVLAGAIPAGAEEYDPMTSERYLDYGRPESQNQLPRFETKRKSFNVAPMVQAQDIKVGKGDAISKGCLVKAKWVISLADGTIVENNTTSGSVLFRVGAGQVAVGIEDSVIGMKKGGSRVARGPSDSFFR